MLRGRSRNKKSNWCSLIWFAVMEQQVLSLVVRLNFRSCKTCGGKPSCIEIISSIKACFIFWIQRSSTEKWNGSLCAASASVPDSFHCVSADEEHFLDLNWLTVSSPHRGLFFPQSSLMNVSVSVSRPLSHVEPPTPAISQPFNKSGSQLPRQSANQSNSGKQV